MRFATKYEIIFSLSYLPSKANETEPTIDMKSRGASMYIFKCTNHLCYDPIYGPTSIPLCIPTILTPIRHFSVYLYTVSYGLDTIFPSIFYHCQVDFFFHSVGISPFGKFIMNVHCKGLSFFMLIYKLQYRMSCMLSRLPRLEAKLHGVDDLVDIQVVVDMIFVDSLQILTKH